MKNARGTKKKDRGRDTKQKYPAKKQAIDDEQKETETAAPPEDDNEAIENCPPPKQSPKVKVLLFPGEEYPFNDKLLHYGAFGYSNGNLVSKKCGVLLCDPNEKPLDDSHEEIFHSIGKYYSPRVDDVVIGTIVQKSSDSYKVDINTYTYAILNTKDFEGATKKTKPNLNMGDVVFARVLKINRYDTPVLSCVSPQSNKSWTSGESMFGGLTGGNVYTFPRMKAWDLLNDNYALTRIQDYIDDYQICIGMNGKLWINAKDSNSVSLIYKVISSSLKMGSTEEIEKMMHQVFLNKIGK